jgi:ABC-type transport system involved in multi-copper enzyme maturation permease subunit
LASNWGNFRTAPLIASLLFPYLVFPWFLVVMILGISPVTGTRLETLTDGILSRPVTRYEYLLASWGARVLVVLGVYLLVIVPAAILTATAQRPVADDTVTIYGVIASLTVVGLVLVFLVSLGFLMGTLLRRPLVAVVVLAFVWFPINVILNTFSLEQFSPISLNQAIPTLLRTPWRTDSSDVSETPTDQDLEAAARQAAQVLNFFSGGYQQPEPRERAFFERDNYQDFSLIRVILGYGLPTLLAIGMATLCFCWRDL